MRKEKMKKQIFRRLIMVFLSSVLILLLSIGFIAVAVYKSGEVALMTSVDVNAPHMDINKTEVRQIKEKYQYESSNSIAWQEDWIVYDNKIYDYRDDTLNFLLMGIDKGGELDKETDLNDWNAGQADSVFVISINQKDKKISIIGIPRNTMVDLEIYNSQEECIDTIYNQICLQYGYAGGGMLGLEKMKESVSELMWNLPIHGACAVSYDAVGMIVDKIGGVDVVVPDDMTEYKSNYTKGSVQTLNSKNVIPYLRYREYDTLGSPTIRLTRQKEFLKSAVTNTMDEIKENPIMVRDIYQSVSKYMNTDITLDEAVFMATKAVECSVSEDSFYQLTGTDKAENFIDKNGKSDFYDDYYIDNEALKKIMIDVFYENVTIYK